VPQIDLSGRTLAGYRVLRKLGQGGMGQVYLAEQISLKRKVALKVLRPEVSATANALARFKSEAEAIAQATHANIVQVYDHGEADGILYMALEYVEGRNLKEYIARKGTPDLQLSLVIMRQVAAALQRAGELGIVHRDIKPENILLTRKGEVKVADFGLSRCLEGDRPALNLTQTGVTMGTPLYMSPEQVEGKPVDSRTDIYSFGVTCYHMLAGQPPFQGGSAFEVALAHVQKQPAPLSGVRPDLPARLCEIVHKMMAKSPADRYQTGRDLLRDIARLRESLSGGTAALSPQPTASVEPAAVTAVMPGEETDTDGPPPPKKGRHGLVAAALVLTVLAALAGGAIFAWRERVREGPLPGAGVTPPSDASTLEAILLPNKREQTLRDAVEQYLNGAKGKPPEPGGFGVCADLALLYLNDHRLAEAEKLFVRLEAIPSPRAYPLLGQLGRGIVLALRNRPTDSNELFKKLFCMSTVRGLEPLGPFRPGKGKKPLADGLVKKVELNLAPISTVLAHDDWRFWLGRARWYNHSNALSEDEVPRYLIVRFPIRPPVAEPPRPSKSAGGAKPPAKT
jgi:serine/threonine-protein kinase